MKPDLSILIPARNEDYLEHTIKDILEHAVGDIEILVGLDGWTPDFLSVFIRDNEVYIDGKVKYFYLKDSIGQRAMQNKLAHMAEGKYVMKLDAHCSMSPGFDKEMIDLMEDDMVMTPIMCDLDVKTWTVKPKPRCVCYRFDKNLVFNYWHEYESKAGYPLANTLAIRGACWMVTKENYFKWDLCDEAFGSWGQQSIEVPLKAWMSGGRVVTNCNCYFGHMFRGPDSFPYERDMKQIEHAYEYCKKQFLEGEWKKGKLTLEQVLDKFKPVPEWH